MKHDVGRPGCAGPERERHPEQIEAPTDRVPEAQQRDPGRCHRDPQSIEDPPRAGQGHTEWTKEFDRDGNPQWDSGDRFEEREQAEA